MALPAQQKTPTPSLVCPKCGAEMRSDERNGVQIEQCLGCRGIFLDRGELEQLIGAESSFLAAGRGDQPGFFSRLFD